MGQYQFETFPLILTVTKEDSRLVVDIPKDGKSELFAESESTFFLKIRPLQMTLTLKIGDRSRISKLLNTERPGAQTRLSESPASIKEQLSCQK
jgi:hypothetical protein